MRPSRRWPCSSPRPRRRRLDSMRHHRSLEGGTAVLRELQQAFREGVLDDRAEAIVKRILGDGIAAERRLGLYRTTVLGPRGRVRGATSPAPRRLAGEAVFAAMARAFVRARPPAVPQLLDYGAE